jgi:phage gpG-like protein
LSAATGASSPAAPLAETTRARKRAQGLPSRALVATGALRDSLTSSSAPGAVRSISREAFRFGTSVDYARYHQHGTRHMPKRRILDVDAGTQEAIGKYLRRYVRGRRR